MWRVAWFSVFPIFVLQAAQAWQNPSHGVPASVTSPSVLPNGQVILHGTPASVTSPPAMQTSGSLSRPAANGARALTPSGRFRRFGNPRERSQRDFIIPIFYPLYVFGNGYGYGQDPTASPADPSAGDPPSSDPSAGGDPAVSGNGAAGTQVASADSDAVKEAYYRGAQDALAAADQQQASSRYGEHFFDSRSKVQQKAPPADPVAVSDDPPSKEDDAPPTIFILKDGRKVETQNFAIVGQTVFDFSTKPIKKIQLPDLDMDATRKANDDRGITLRLP